MLVTTLRCPGCGQSVEVDGPMREALLRSGCVLCGAGLSPADFD